MMARITAATRDNLRECTGSMTYATPGPASVARQSSTSPRHSIIAGEVSRQLPPPARSRRRLRVRAEGPVMDSQVPLT
jgi:hypothetical protein